MPATTAQFPDEQREGRFVRQANAFTARITADGSSGYPAEAGRYHLYAALACPWACRQLITMNLKGLNRVITVSLADPIRDERGWAFTTNHPDPVGGFDFLSQAYLATDPSFSGRYTVPAVWDRETGEVVTNDYPVIDIQLDGAFHHLAENDVTLYPPDLRDEIDALDARIFPNVNNGVYKAGFATTQAAYEEAFDALFEELSALDERLASRRFLAGDRLTLADIRLYTTLVRFDPVYYSHFKCNLRRIEDYPHLAGYLRDLYQRPAFREATDFSEIKRHYYGTHPALNPSGIVPKGPALHLDRPHGRDHLG